MSFNKKFQVSVSTEIRNMKQWDEIVSRLESFSALTHLGYWLTAPKLLEKLDLHKKAKVKIGFLAPDLEQFHRIKDFLVCMFNEMHLKYSKISAIDISRFLTNHVTESRRKGNEPNME